MRQRRTTSKAIAQAIELRKNPTEAEQRLWQYLRMRQLEGIYFRRQHPIGPYIVDFCAPSRKLIIELDGGQHLEQEKYDAERTAFLEQKGYRVLRFWNNEINENLDGMIREILEVIEEL